MRWPHTAPGAAVDTHEGQGTPQAQGMSVPSAFAAVKTNGRHRHRRPLYPTLSCSASVSAEPGAGPGAGTVAAVSWRTK